MKHAHCCIAYTVVYCSGSIPDETVAAAKHTQHKWGFMKKLSDKDRDALASTANSVKVTTATAADLGSSNTSGSTTAKAATSSGATSARATVAPRKETSDEYDDRRAVVQQRRSGLKQQNAVLLDEIAPKETGRAAAIDKRKGISASMHDAARVSTCSFFDKLKCDESVLMFAADKSWYTASDAL
jgi:hypothetical protein